MPGHKVPSKAKQSYKFIEAHSNEFSVKTVYQVLDVARAGYYAWLDHPL